MSGREVFEFIVFLVVLCGGAYLLVSISSLLKEHIKRKIEEKEDDWE